METQDNIMQPYEWHQLPNFGKEEFSCSCGCDRADMDKNFIFSLQALRTKLNAPVFITSGYRCENHPIEKAKIDAGGKAGTHSLGLAVDISVPTGYLRYRLLQASMGGFTGIGIADKQGFVHLDMALEKHGFNRPNLWTY